MAERLRSKVQKRLDSLSERKSRIERMIQQELGRSMPCWLTLQQLKRLRLRVKDHMASLRFGMADHSFGKG
jgi:hypothetical protein